MTKLMVIGDGPGAQEALRILLAKMGNPALVARDQIYYAERAAVWAYSRDIHPLLSRALVRAGCVLYAVSCGNASSTVKVWATGLDRETVFVVLGTGKKPRTFPGYDEQPLPEDDWGNELRERVFRPAKGSPRSQAEAAFAWINQQESGVSRKEPHNLGWDEMLLRAPTKVWGNKLSISQPRLVITAERGGVVRSLLLDGRMPRPNREARELAALAPIMQLLGKPDEFDDVVASVLNSGYCITRSDKRQQVPEDARMTTPEFRDRVRRRCPDALFVIDEGPVRVHEQGYVLLISRTAPFEQVRHDVFTWVERHRKAAAEMYG